MENAERLLLEGKFNISEIAYKVGMNSTGYFRQCFKEEFGLSPSDYLKQIKCSKPISAAYSIFLRAAPFMNAAAAAAIAHATPTSP